MLVTLFVLSGIGLVASVKFVNVDLTHKPSKFSTPGIHKEGFLKYDRS